MGGVFSPDGGEVAMVLSSSGNPELYIANSNGHSPKRITQSKGLKAAPCWSSDGKQKSIFHRMRLDLHKFMLLIAMGQGLSVFQQVSVVTVMNR